jgi:hypothetical protein
LISLVDLVRDSATLIPGEYLAWMAAMVGEHGSEGSDLSIPAANDGIEELCGKHEHRDSLNEPQHFGRNGRKRKALPLRTANDNVQARITKSAEALAHYLGHSSSWLRVHYPELRAQGFPRRDDLLDGWDLKAVDEWLDRRSKVGDRVAGLANLQRAELEREFGIGKGRYPVSS